MLESNDIRLARANKIIAELKEAGMSDKELNKVSLLVLLELGCREQNTPVDSDSI